MLLAILVAQASFNLKFISPDSNQQLYFFVTLTGLIFGAFVALSFVLGRNLLKLYAERRQGVAGSKFRTRLVVVNLLLSFLPVIAMFWFSYGLMNRSIDKWFSQPVEEVRADTAAMSAFALRLRRPERHVRGAVHRTVGGISKRLRQKKFFRRQRRTAGTRADTAGRIRRGLGGWRGESRLEHPCRLAANERSLPGRAGPARRTSAFSVGPDRLCHWRGSLEGNGAVLVALPLPLKFAETARQIQESQQRYVELARQRKLVRRTYLGFLLLLTVLVLFASTWLALFLSKLVNRPVAAIAAGTEAISKGQLDYRVDIRATDELAELVQSFNSMAEQLESSRRQIEASSRELGNANEALEGRRRYIETVLESIPTGVVSIDGARRVTLANAAFSRMFHPERPEFASPAALANLPLRELLPADVLADLEPLLRRADRMGLTAANMEIGLAPRQAQRGCNRGRARISGRSAWDMCWSSKTSLTCCAPRSRRPGAKSRAALHTRSRIR